MKRPDLVLALVIAVGLLGSPFYNTELVRSQLIGGAPVGALGSVLVLCTGLALAWRATLRRGYLWAHPATLTWDDFDGQRPVVLTRRLVLDWAARFAVAAYFFAVSGMLIGFPSSLVGPIALFVVVAALALTMGRRRSFPGESLLPLTLALPLIVPLWTYVVAAGLASVALARSSSVPHTASRDTLIRHYAERMVRRTSAAFLDVWALLPAGRPVPWRNALAGRFIVTRYVVTGTLARRSALGLPVFLALAVVATHATFPAVTSVWLLGVGGYLALLPFTAPVAQLHRVPGLRRWLDASNLRLNAVTCAFLCLLAVLWAGVVLLLGIPASVSAIVAVLIAALSAVRSVTRGPLDFSSMGMVLYEGVLIPAGLVRQLVRGPDLLVLGLIAASFLPI
ncbi:hypothetical protein [Amycolatopsis rubida]|uniref:Uncharacterized protein n=1 Tax=Amycolatopsis rubida TaxID=112413 RepID=A0A1I5FDX6_9PSEU|nr:hypothetical protein [Amycolatopsis rubida]SFO21955.1 hypothetical protein SAMN05421854_1011072 [Amycolatopsis rubida]